jgi:hypothetical protein
LTEGLKKLAVLEESLGGKIRVKPQLSHSFERNPSIYTENMAEDPVCSEPVSAGNSLYQGNLQGKWSTRGCIRLRVLGKDPSHGHFDDSLEFHACLRTGN